MSALRLAVLVVLGATCCVAALTSNPDTPECALLVDEVKEHIEEELAPLKAAIEDVQRTVKSLATLKSVGDLHTSISSLMTNTLLTVEIQLEDLPTKADLKKLLKEQPVAEVQETCGNGEKLDELAEAVREVHGRVEEAKEAAQETRSKVEECVQQDVTDELRGVGEKVQEVVLRVGGLKNDLETQLPYIGGRVEELTNTTQLLKDAVEEKLKREEAEQALAENVPTYPCLDSTFSGSINATCQLAVRFSRCSLPKVSYHCCRTCTDAGLLPETGPWLKQNLPRVVTTLETLRFFAP